MEEFPPSCFLILACTLVYIAPENKIVSGFVLEKLAELFQYILSDHLFSVGTITAQFIL
jgi:hypothetical protein